MLYIVATPIGNLKDISLRAIEVLKTVDLIACEDTRHTKILLTRYGIDTPTTSYFEHNKIIKGKYLLELLRQGKNVALVSDAGTPGILDPGYNIINSAVQHEIPLTVVPGPSALVSALVLSGKPAHQFIFEGFLPSRTVARQNRLKMLAPLKYTLVFYESSHRILATLKDIGAVFGDKEIVVARELTKKFEEALRGNPLFIAEALKKAVPKGEFVVVV